MLRLSLALYATTTQLSMPFCIPTSYKWKFLCLLLTSNWCPQFGDLGHSVRCVVVFYCYNLHSLIKKNHSEHLFTYVLSVICVSSPVRSLGHLSMVYLCFIIELCVICILLVQVLRQGFVLMVCSQVCALSFHSLKWVFLRIEVFNFNTF